MSKYLLYMLNKNCAEIRNGCHNIAVSLGGHFLAHPVLCANLNKKWACFTLHIDFTIIGHCSIVESKKCQQVFMLVAWLHFRCD